jgi:hypothetical protein
LLGSLLRLASLAYLPDRYQDARRERRSFVKRAKEANLRPDDLAGVYGVTTSLLARAPERYLLSSPSLADFPIVKRPLVRGLYLGADHPSICNSDLVPDILRTSPYSHRPLIEFVIGAPQLAFWGPTFPRVGMQRALAGIIPASILSRASKGDPRVALARIKRADMDDFAARGVPSEPAAEWQLVKRGYIEVSSLERSLQILADRQHSVSDLLNRCVPLEAWLRSLDVRAVGRGTGPSTVHLKTGTTDR